MVKLIIADKDFNNVKDIINNVTSKNNDIKISQIICSSKEFEEKIEAFDVMLVNANLEIEKIINKIYEDEKFYNSVLVITSSIKNIEPIIESKYIYDYVIEGTNYEEIGYKIDRLIKLKDKDNKLKDILKELKYIGYNIEYVGTKYLAESILEIYFNKEKMLDNLQKEIYPIVAMKYNKSVHNVKCNINRATECMYYDCDSERLKKYFGFYDDIKPTAKIVAFTVLNKI